MSTVLSWPAPAQTRANAGRCILLSQMREHGFSGGQGHALAVRDLLAGSRWDAELLTPFSGPAALRTPAFALRRGLRPFSRQAAIWWYREGHNLYLRKALRRALGPDSAPAILYAQDPLSAQAALALRRPGLDKVILVVHFNDSQASEWAVRGEMPANGRVFRSIEALERTILPQVDTLVYVSRYMRGRIEQRIPAAARVPSFVIPNFVQRPRADPRARTADVLSIGTLEPRKNQAYTLRVLAELHRRGLPCTTTFLGGGEDQARLEVLARGLGLSAHVHFAGNVRNAAGWLERHRVLAHAAELENCPVALIEALAAGIPVVAARVGGIPELIDETTGAFWDLGSIEDGANKLQALLVDETGWRAASREARARYEEQFSPEKAGRQLLELFAGLLGR